MSAADNQKEPRSETPEKRDLISRGDYTPSPAEKTLFFLLRGIEPILQYSILAHGLGSSLFQRLGLRMLPPGLAAHTGIGLIDSLGLSPTRLVLLGMSIGSAIKQNIWVAALAAEPVPIGNAVSIAAFNAVFNSLSSYTFLLGASASTESNFPQPALVLGSALYLVGITTELVSEIQRKQFKSDPKNKGKAYTEGLWQFARHINYGGYTLWRAGYAMAGGGFALGALVGAFFFADFATRAIPILNEYCGKRYGAAWERFKQDTPYQLIPFIY